MALGRPSSLQRLAFSFLLSLHLAVVLVLMASPSPAAGSQDFVQKTCASMDKASACNKYVLSAPWAIACNDVKCLADAVIPNLAKPVTSAGYDYAQKVEDKDPSEELKACVTNYQEALSSLDDAVESIQSGDYSRAGEGTDDAEGYINTCENGFSTKPTPLTANNTEVADVIDVAGNIIDLMYL